VRKASENPAWYFVDEAGDPAFYGAGKKIIVGTAGCSKTLSLGYLHTRDPQQIRSKLAEVRLEVSESNYLKNIPTVRRSLLAFHATDDCPEVRHLVYEALMKTDFSAQVIVARKREQHFREAFGGSQDRYYEALVTALFRHRLHLNTPTQIIFSRRGNKSRQRALREAVELAAQRFRQENVGASQTAIDVQTSQMIQEPALQGIDYVMWSVQRAYERGEMRYFEFLRDRIELVWDIYDWEKMKIEGLQRKVYYDRKNNPFDIKKASPLS